MKPEDLEAHSGSILEKEVRKEEGINVIETSEK